MKRYFKNKYTGVIAECLSDDGNRVVIQPETLKYHFSIYPKNLNCSWIEIKDAMNKEFDLIDILKEVPFDTPIYSSTFGDCRFQQVTDHYNSNYIQILTENKYLVYLNRYGHLKGIENGECIIFPSKENRDWSTFKVPWKPKHFEPFQRVLVRTDSHDYWKATLYSNYIEGTNTHLCINGYAYNDASIIPFKGNKDKLGKIID